MSARTAGHCLFMLDVDPQEGPADWRFCGGPATFTVLLASPVPWQDISPYQMDSLRVCDVHVLPTIQRVKHDGHAVLFRCAEEEA